jgi:hypothetical protein
MEKRKPKQADPIGENVELDKAVVASAFPPRRIDGHKEIVSPNDLHLGRASTWLQSAFGDAFGPESVGRHRQDCSPATGWRDRGVFQEGWSFTPDLQDSLNVGQGASEAVGADMMKGAFEAEQALYTFIPGHVPQPVAWGTYIDDPDTHFYMCEFVEMYDDLPGACDWAAVVSTLHLNSMGKSPTGEFGFHVPTHLANVPVNNTWNSSWETFWAQQMKSLLDQDERINGLDEELGELKKAFFERAIPRYLRPLETEGRSIKPCLIHSDLWPGNIKPKTSSDELCMFDACAYWGHNEGLCQYTLV